MNRKKAFIVGGVVLLLVIAVVATIKLRDRDVVEVQTGKVAREELVSTVSASGEIRPKVYVNVGANAFGKITHLFVKEGDHVKQGQLLAQIENVQPSAGLAAQRASLESSQVDVLAAEANLNRSKADLESKKLDWDRAQGLYKDGLIPKSQYDTTKAAYDVAVATLAQAKAQLDSARSHVSQNSAMVTQSADVLSKTEYRAPFDGVVTSLPVREGETVVIGIQNAPGSTLMTLADMSVITAEVKVDETDIVSVKLGQPAEVTIDAIPNKTFHGTVTEIGDNAIVRSTGLSTSQSTTSSQEAKDFKVVVTLSDPPENLRPGLSTTAKITTAKKDGVLAIPIQALTIRQKGDLEEKKKNGSVQAAAPTKPTADQKQEIQGVFVVGKDHKAKFVPVETGITGTTDIEVSKGLNEGDEIITGSYKILRTLKNNAGVKVNNSMPKPEESGS
jgi:HlyD family secretion protein